MKPTDENETMAEIILYTLLAGIVIIILAVLLPIRIVVTARGGWDAEFHGKGRIMLFGGLLGGGGEYDSGEARVGLYLGPMRIFSRDASRFSSSSDKECNKEEHEEPDKKEDQAGTKPDISGVSDKKAEETAVKPKKERAPERPARRKKARGAQRIKQQLNTLGKYAAYMKIILHGAGSLFRVDRFGINVTLGLGDPAWTGRILGILYAINGALPKKYSIRPGYDFSRRVIFGDADVKMTFKTYLFWVHLARGYRTYRKYHREERSGRVKNFGAQEA